MFRRNPSNNPQTHSIDPTTHNCNKSDHKKRRRAIVIFALVLGIYLALVCHVFALSELQEPVPPNIAPPPDCSADFVVFGDSQGSYGPHWPVAPSFEKMLPLINQIDVPLAFHVGDMYNGDDIFNIDVEKQVKRFLDDMAELQIPWYPVMGNHDAAGKGWEVTRERIFGGGSTYYSFDKANSHFVILDAYMPGHSSSISEEQFKWLQDDLSRTTQPHIFVFVHAPLYPIGSHIGGSLDKYPQTRQRLVSLILEHQVDVVFCGHEHLYAGLEYDGLVQVTTGGAGGLLQAPKPLVELTSKYGYVADDIGRLKAVNILHYVTVQTSEKAITISAYDLQGNRIDHFSIPS